MAIKSSHSPPGALTPSARAVSLETAGVLLALGRRRRERVDLLGSWVATAVEEHRRPSDPPGRWDPCWLHDLRPWVRLVPIDRLRQGHDNLLTLEVQCKVVCDQMVAAAVTPLDALRLLAAMGSRRADVLEGLGRTERALRSRLASPTSQGLRAAVRALVRAEAAAAGELDRLAQLSAAA